MKPAFALDFRNDAIALLHRTSGGWHLVGRVALDEPDLAEALAYLRSTALGLSPRGLTTKLILPDDQLLVTTVDAPGPDAASRTAQIRAALEGRTPYAVEDLVFDWEEVAGEVRVAVVARETLDEAEGFANEHRFNPIGFAAAPARGFDGEAWFGPTTQAATHLPDGMEVERDLDRTVTLDRPLAAEPVAEAKDDAAEPEAGSGPMAEETAPPEAFAETSPEPKAAPEVTAEPADEPAHQPTQDNAALEARTAPLFGLADDEPPPSAVFRSLAEKDPAPLPEEEQAPASDALPREDLAPENLAAEDLAPPATDAAEPPASMVAPDEAPMAIDVEVEDGDPEGAKPADDGREAPANAKTASAVLDDVPPVPGYSPSLGFASRRASADPAAAKGQATPPRPSVDRPTAARPLMAAPPPKIDRPVLNRPTAARPVAPKESKGLRGLGAFVTAPGIPGTRKKPVEPVPPRETPAARSTPASAAPAAATAAQPAAASSAAPAQGGLGRKFGARPVATRGKPRHLGLILTGLLLLALAVVAAWSTSLAFRNTDEAVTEFAAVQESETPAIEDEMAADGQEPDLLSEEDLAAALPADSEAAAPDTAAAEEGAAETAETGSETGSETGLAPLVSAAPETTAPGAVATNPGAASGDEIFLAAKDIAPVTPDATALAEVPAQGDPMPSAQAPPPPFGTTYQFDERGLIVPTPEGIITPEGVLLVAGKPPRLPAPRPEGLAPSAETATASADTGFVSDPALAAFRPKARPAGLTPPAPATPPEATDGTGAPENAAQDDAALSPDAPLPAADSRLAGLRPQARPEAVLAAGEAAHAAASAAAASLAAQAEAAAAEAAAAASAAPTSPLAVAISRKPEPRPRDLSRAVEAAVAAAIRAPEPAPEPQEEQQAAARPSQTPEPEAEEESRSASAKSIPRGRDGALDIYEEPEVEASAPRSTASASVAKQATFRNALNLDKTALIGVYGTPNKRYAMIRSANGRYKKVKVGDNIDGGKIQAITANEVRYQKGSRLVTLSLPRG